MPLSIGLTNLVPPLRDGALLFKVGYDGFHPSSDSSDSGSSGSLGSSGSGSLSHMADGDAVGCALCAVQEARGSSFHITF